MKVSSCCHGKCFYVATIIKLLPDLCIDIDLPVLFVPSTGFVPLIVPLHEIIVYVPAFNAFNRFNCPAVDVKFTLPVTAIVLTVVVVEFIFIYEYVFPSVKFP